MKIQQEEQDSDQQTFILAIGGSKYWPLSPPCTSSTRMKIYLEATGYS